MLPGVGSSRRPKAAPASGVRGGSTEEDPDVSDKLPTLAFFALLVPVALAQEPGGRRAPAAQDPLVARLDADGDAALSAAEIARAGAVLASLDSDGDGALSARELGALAPRGAPPPRGAAASLEAPPLAADDGERRAMEVLAALDRDRRGNLNVPENDGRFLRMLVEATGAMDVVEIGTSNGYSSIWMALGLRATGGRIRTLEIDPRRAEVAAANFERAGVTDRVTIVRGDAHETVTELADGIDLVFIDADKDGYLDYLQKVLPKMRPGGLIVAHNMANLRPDPRFVDAITKDPRLETLFFHMSDAGIAVSLKKREVAGAK
jgi:predicted O-methyltransferase YrrM